MDDDLRDRRESHLLYLRMGVPYSTRMKRLAREFDVPVGTVKADESRIDTWIDDVGHSASFEKKASFLLHQLRSQTAGHERLAEKAKQERQEAAARLEELQETFQAFRDSPPEELGFEEPAGYYRELSKLARQMHSTDEDVKDWAREERLTRGAVADNVVQEFEARQSIGEIETEPDRLEIDVEERVEERKVFAGVDLASFPGIEDARLIGADLDRGDDLRVFEDGEPVSLEERPDDEDEDGAGGDG